jgi:predicted acylesterase/phospholipase RssA
MKQYNTIVISGGSVKGIGALGAVQYIYDNQCHVDITKYIGTSIGSIICYFLIIGYTPIEIIICMNQNNLLNKLSNINILSLTQCTGGLDWSILHDFIEKHTYDKTDEYDFTLLELYSTFEKEIIIPVFNNSDKKTEYLSRETHPDLSCLSAIRMSSNLPLVFDRFKYNGCYYIDGGFGNNLPIDLTNSGDIVFAVSLNKFCERVEPSEEKKYSLFTTIIDILSLSVHINEKNSLKFLTKEEIHIDLIRIPDILELFEFNISKTKILDVFSSGYQITKKYFDEQTSSDED